jgi:pimeloyl-ACP methyl ester carboxylesterase
VTFTHGYADNRGLRMYYELHGRAVLGQPPLLLIPGGGSTIGTNFGELIPLLAEQRQVISVEEEEGHGRTQPTSRPLTAENSAGDILVVLDQLSVETVDVLGFSAGGHTAIALTLGRPAIVRRLIAASTFASRDAVPDEFWDGMAKATLDDLPDTYKDAEEQAASGGISGRCTPPSRSCCGSSASSGPPQTLQQPRPRRRLTPTQSGRRRDLPPSFFNSARDAGPVPRLRLR